MRKYSRGVSKAERGYVPLKKPYSISKMQSSAHHSLQYTLASSLTLGQD